jgi:hypothetical protein
MRECRKKVVMGLLLAAILSIGTIPGARAQEEGGLAKQIQGSWILVSNINEQDGKKSDVFGPNPRGFMVLTHEGRFSIVMMKASLPKIVSNNRLKSTAEENQAILQGSFAAFGTYKVVNEKENRFIMHYEATTFPNWDGQDLSRTMIVSGDEMKHINPTAAVGGMNYLIWKRVK